MAVTLQTIAKATDNPIKKGIIMNLLRKCPLMDLVPFENVSALTNIAVRWTSLPDVAFRKINAGYTASEGDIDQVYESVYAFGGEIQLDRVYKKITSTMIQDPRVMQMDMKSTAMALTFGYYFINGDHAVNPDGFEGLKKRISNMPARQKIRASATTDILDPTASVANARLFVDKWDEAMFKANGGDVQAILSNEGIRWGIGRVLRFAAASGGSLLDVTKDLFGRDILTYKGAPILDAGLYTDQTTEIISAAETAEDGGSDATSAYFLPFNMENGITGIQLSDMEVYDPLSGAEMPTLPANLVRVEWWCGLAGFGSYGPTRLHNIETPASWT